MHRLRVESVRRYVKYGQKAPRTRVMCSQSLGKLYVMFYTPHFTRGNSSGISAPSHDWQIAYNKICIYTSSLTSSTQKCNEQCRRQRRGRRRVRLHVGRLFVYKYCHAKECTHVLRMCTRSKAIMRPTAYAHKQPSRARVFCRQCSARQCWRPQARAIE